MWLKLVLFILHGGLLCAYAAGNNIVPFRSVYNFGGMISKVTGRRPIDFINYGNWCGLGGGGQPLDDVDRCCQAHDACYSDFNSNHLNCRSGFGYFIAPYINHYQWEFNEQENRVVCSEENSDCKQFLCLCDKICAECFAATIYHPELNKI